MAATLWEAVSDDVVSEINFILLNHDEDNYWAYIYMCLIYYLLFIYRGTIHFILDSARLCIRGSKQFIIKKIKCDIQRKSSI